MIIHAVLSCTDNILFIVTSAATKLLNLPTDFILLTISLILSQANTLQVFAVVVVVVVLFCFSLP